MDTIGRENLPDELIQYTEAVEVSEQEVGTSYREFLREHAPVNFGKDALIYFLGRADMTPALLELLEESGMEYPDSAMKVLKVYAAGEAAREFGWQNQAYSIIESHIAEHPGDKDLYARVPKPLDQRAIEIDEETRLALNHEGATIAGHKVELMVMDFIHGEDLATLMYRWVVDHCPEDKEYVARNIRPNNFADLQDAIAQILEFEKLNTSGLTEADRNIGERKLNMQNGKRVYAFLKKTGFQISAQIIDQIKNTRQLLANNGLNHNDEHERNFMVIGNQAYFIDFARASGHIDEGSEARIEQELEQFTGRYEQTKRAESEADRLSKLGSIRAASAAGDILTLSKALLESSQGDAKELQKLVTNRGIGATSSEKSLESFLSLLVKLVDEHKLTRDNALSVIEDIKQSLIIQETKRRKVISRITNQFVYNIIDNYRALFN